jgi:hypothetical protein
VVFFFLWEMIDSFVDIGGIDEYHCNDLYVLTFIRLHSDFMNIYWFAHLSSGERIYCIGGKRYNDACYKDRKSLQGILHICEHSQIFRRVSYLIVACEDVSRLYKGLCTYALIHRYIFRRVCCLIVDCGDVYSLYRGLCTYAHIHRYLGEWVIWLWLIKVYKVSTESCAHMRSYTDI